MATLASDIITKRARLILNDTAVAPAPQRWADSTLMLFLNDAVTRIIQLRPDAQLNAAGAIFVIVPVAALGSAISIEDKWLIPICHYICARSLEMQGGELLNLNASNHFQHLFDDTVKSL